MHFDDVRVMNRRGRAHFALEPSAIVDAAALQKLQRESLARDRVRGLPNDADSTFTNRANEPIAARDDRVWFEHERRFPHGLSQRIRQARNASMAPWRT